MGTPDPRVDAYIAEAAAFARPILERLRALVHAHCPPVVETIKWGFPHFEYQGVLCSMAAFKRHCAFGFWKGELVLGGPGASDAMGQFGRMTVLADLPDEARLGAWIQRAMELNAQGVKSPRRTAAARKPVADELPADLAEALAGNPAAGTAFARFPPSHRREYIAWLAEAKRAPTRQRRLIQALEWIAQGRSRNWKYEKC